MKNLTVIVVLLAWALLFVMCEHDPITPDDPNNPDNPTDTTDTPGNPTDTTGTGGNNGQYSLADCVSDNPVTPSDDICFNTQILPIFVSNCAKSGCHDAVSHQHGYVFTSYAGVMEGIDDDDPLDSEIAEVISENDPDDRMPPPPNPPLTNAQINLIYQWMLQGAQNTDCETGGGTNIDTTNIRYSVHVAPILANNCLGCHNNATHSGNIYLEGYNNVKTVAQSGQLFGAVAHLPGYTPMPLGLPQISDCDIALIKKWIDLGAPNN